jgi:hypothetical protein
VRARRRPEVAVGRLRTAVGGQAGSPSRRPLVGGADTGLGGLGGPGAGSGSMTKRRGRWAAGRRLGAEVTSWAAEWMARHQLSAAEMITAERARHVDGKGLVAFHDDQYRDGELVAAAIAYATVYRMERQQKQDRRVQSEVGWPTSLVCAWKPATPVRDLVRAASLIAAEIDRLIRERPEVGYWESEATRLQAGGEDPGQAEAEAAVWAALVDYHDAGGRCGSDDCYHCNSRCWSEWSFPGADDGEETEAAAGGAGAVMNVPGAAL